VADPSGEHPELYLPLLNKASQAMIEQGLYVGLYGEMDFYESTECITLDRRFESIIADNLCGSWARGSVPIISKIQVYNTYGPRHFENREWKLNILSDDGQFPTKEVQYAALPIKITIADPDDAGQTVVLQGFKTDGSVWYENGAQGIEVTTVFPSVTTSQSILLSNVIKPITEGSMTIATVDGLVERVLSVYEPTEVDPLYRRYRVGSYDARTDGLPIIRTLCKRKFIPLINENDPIFPSNLRALQFAMNACKLEAYGAYEVTEAQKFWDGCYDSLNAQLRQFRGKILTPSAWTPRSSGQAVPTTR
jgi:hypothetical protein